MCIDNQTHDHQIMLYHFEKGWKAAKSFCNFNKLFGEGTNSKGPCRESFPRFKSGDTSLKDKPGKGRQSNFDSQALLSALEWRP
ncbi:histone-lysine N-methyltransferase SETMAR [Trichonephila clavipes]|nr:histone-lysine N-methyltransferase SETMAR [Trichonephila clavipes]